MATRHLGAIIWGAGLLLVFKGATPTDYIGPELLDIILLALLIAGLVVLLADTSNLARRRSAFVVTTLSVLLTVFLLEIPALLGLLDFRRVLGAPAADAMLSPHNVLDPILLHRRRPRLVLRGETRGGDLCAIYGAPAWRTYRYSVVYDENGFRNPPGMSRADVVVIGDSFIEAGLASDEELLTSVLARESGLTVANLGQSAYGPEQELEVLRRFAVGFEPKICIWAFFEGNDLSDSAMYPARRARYAELAKPLSALKRRSFLWNTQEALRRALRTPEPRHEHARHVGRCEAGVAPIDYYFHHALRSVDTYARELEQLQNTLRSAHEECRQRGIRLVVLFLPAKYRVYHEVCTFPKGSACSEWVVSEMPRRVERLVSDVSPEIPFLDCTPALQAAARSGEMVFFPDDTHWTEAGQRVAAEVIRAGLDL